MVEFLVVVKAEEAIQELVEASNEPELLHELKDELVERRLQFDEATHKLKLQLLPIEEEEAASSIILEIRPAAGGKEASLFAGELFHM